MQQSGQPNESRNAYLQAWAKMMVTIWQDKIRMLNVRDTGELFASFNTELLMQSGGDISKITHAYNYYGRMVDMGVGRGLTKAESGRGSKRRSKPWYMKAYYHSFMVLSEKSAQLYGEEFQLKIYEMLNF